MSSTWSSGPDARSIVIVAIVAALSMPAVTTRLYAADEFETFSYLRSLWFDHDVSFDNEYRHFVDSGAAADPGFRKTFLELTTETGLRLNFNTIGCALLWAPFYGVADAGVRVARLLGSTVEADGFSRPYVAAVCYGSAFYGWLALVVSLLCARKLLRTAGEQRSRPAVLAMWSVLLGTPLLFYMYVSPPFTHAVSAFAAAVFVWVWLSVREDWSPRGAALLGVAAALMAMVREQDAFLAIGPGLDFARTWFQRRDLRMARAAIVGVAAGALAFIPQALAYLSLNGRVGPSRLVGRKMTWTAPHALDVLASPEHGWLLWTPLVAMAALGWCVMLTWRADVRQSDSKDGSMRWIGLCMIVMALSQVYVSGSVESWTVAGGFGQRRFVVLSVLLAAGLSFLFARLRDRISRGVAAVLVVGCIWWNVGLTIQFGAGWMDRQRLDLAQNAYNTFVTVPRRLPEIAYRYLFERQRFYRTETAPAPRH